MWNIDKPIQPLFCSSMHHVGDSKDFSVFIIKKKKKLKEQVRWRPCPLSLKNKSKEINKALKGSFVTQKAKNPQSPYNIWTMKSCAKEQILLSQEDSLSEQQFKDLWGTSTQVDKTQDNATKTAALCIEALCFLLLADFCIHLRVRLT